jgi:hypothetical protein
LSGPRSYLTGTERALFELAKGTCYFPGCPALTTVFVEGMPITNVHISHIHGAKRGSARFDEAMTDKERASFANLLLLCKPHHDLIDRIDPDRFSPKLLRQWKVDREGQDVGALNELQGLTEQRLAEMLEQVIFRVGPQRDVKLEVTGGAILDAGNAVTVPLDGWQRLLDLNPSGIMSEKVVVATIRNTGTLAVAVEGISIAFRATTGETPLVPTLLGRNDHRAINPALPKRLDVGESTNWFTSLDTFQWLLAGSAQVGADIAAFRFEATLGSGEKILSDYHSTSHLPLSPTIQ